MKHKFLIFTILAVILSSCSTPTNLSTIPTSSTTEHQVLPKPKVKAEAKEGGN